MKVGDLVVQRGWEANAPGPIGVGIIIKMWQAGSLCDRARVQWPRGAVDMYQSQLKVISESR